MTQERMVAWSRLFLKRESLSADDPEREVCDKALDDFLHEATPEQRTHMIKLMECIDRALEIATSTWLWG
jgi:hypothetical protein